MPGVPPFFHGEHQRLTTPGGDQPEDCPTCGLRYVAQCRCPARRRVCPGGHAWYASGTRCPHL